MVTAMITQFKNSFLSSKKKHYLTAIFVAIFSSLVTTIFCRVIEVHAEIKKDISYLDQIVSDAISPFLDKSKSNSLALIKKNCSSQEIGLLKDYFISHNITAIPIVGISVETKLKYCSPFGILSFDANDFTKVKHVNTKNKSWIFARVPSILKPQHVSYLYGYNGSNGFLYPLRKDFLFFEEDSKDQRHVTVELTSSGQVIWTIGNMDKRERLFSVTLKSSYIPVTYQAYISKQRIIDSIYRTLWPDATALTLALIMIAIISVSFAHTKATLQIHQMISEGEFVPYYQPIIDTSTKQLVGVEVLVRLKDKKGRIILPGQFIDYLESTKAILPITQQLVEDAFEELHPFISINSSFKCSVNITALHLENDDFYHFLKRQHLPTYCLSLEITERYPITDWDSASAAVARLKSLGLSVSLDDAGTGFGGNSYLQYLDLDTVKIDRIFTNSITSGNSGVLDSYVVMAQQLGLNIIAEGVETQLESTELHLRGVYIQQGYFHGKPMPVDELLAWSRTRGFIPDIKQAIPEFT